MATADGAPVAEDAVAPIVIEAVEEESPIVDEAEADVALNYGD